MNGLLLLIVGLATLALFATTRPGRALLARTRLRDRIPDAANRADLDYLLAACGGDRAEMRRRLDLEREQVPELTEAEHVRRAIRKKRNERNERTEATQGR